MRFTCAGSLALSAAITPLPTVAGLPSKGRQSPRPAGPPGSPQAMNFSPSIIRLVPSSFAMAYGIGPISGCHVNPAVSFGAFVAGRMSLSEMVQYWLAQFVGAAAGAGILYLIASGQSGYEIGDHGLGSNGWGPGYLGEYSM